MKAKFKTDHIVKISGMYSGHGELIGRIEEVIFVEWSNSFSYQIRVVNAQINRAYVGERFISEIIVCPKCKSEAISFAYDEIQCHSCSNRWNYE